MERGVSGPHVQRPDRGPARHQGFLVSGGPPLSADWDDIVRLAPEVGSDQRKWARSPRGLSGLDEGDFQEILEKVPTGWLMVLGASGSGKTMLMIRTLREIIESRAAMIRCRSWCR